MRLRVAVDGVTFDVEVAPGRVAVDGEAVDVRAPGCGEPFDHLLIDGRPYEFTLVADPRLLLSPAGLHRIEVKDASGRVARPLGRDGRVKAPIPGLVRRVPIAAGDLVRAGQTLLVLEAMKMENAIAAPLAGRVASLHVTEGQGVGLGDLLVEVTPA
jgi:biotin carboxyl carrier protein